MQALMRLQERPAKRRKSASGKAATKSRRSKGGSSASAPARASARSTSAAASPAKPADADGGDDADDTAEAAAVRVAVCLRNVPPGVLMIGQQQWIARGLSLNSARRCTLLHRAPGAGHQTLTSRPSTRRTRVRQRFRPRQSWAVETPLGDGRPADRPGAAGRPPLLIRRGLQTGASLMRLRLTLWRRSRYCHATAFHLGETH